MACILQGYRSTGLKLSAPFCFGPINSKPILDMGKSIIKLLFVALLFLIASCGTSDKDGGSDKSDDKVEKFLGTWNVSDQPARLNYIVKIKPSPLSSDKVIMDNFADLGGSAIGLVVNNTIVIDKQEIRNGFKSEGSGDYVNENKLQFEFFLDDGIDNELRKATYTK
jgi:hypothetical protein